MLNTEFKFGAVAQLGERMTGSHEVRGSIPLSSTFKIKGLTHSSQSEKPKKCPHSVHPLKRLFFRVPRFLETNCDFFVHGTPCRICDLKIIKKKISCELGFRSFFLCRMVFASFEGKVNISIRPLILFGRRKNKGSAGICPFLNR